MDLTSLRDRRSWIIAALILFFMGTALVLRLIPVFFIRDSGFLATYDTDSWYTLRQVEVMVRHFPQYAWFDPMTAFPVGKMIDWGPVYPFIASVACLLTGSTSRTAIVFISGWIAPLMAMAMVPVAYQLGKTVWNRRAGLVAAGLIAIVSVQYFALSSYGWVDHHAGEVLFSSLFCLGYLSSIVYARSHMGDLESRRDLPYLFGLPVATSLIFSLSLFVSTTLILFLAVVTVYTVVQSFLDFFTKKDTGYLLLVNGILSAGSVVLLVLFGFRYEGLSIIRYSIGIPLVLLVFTGMTAGLYLLSRYLRGRTIGYIITVALLFAGAVGISQAYPPLRVLTAQAVSLVSGSSEFSVSVVETLPWTWAAAWDDFNGALILMCGGLLILAYYCIRRREASHLFLLIWSVLVLLLTVRFQRFAYFLAVTVALLAAICITESLKGWTQSGWARAQLSSFLPGGRQKDDRTGTTARKKRSPVASRRKKPSGGGGEEKRGLRGSLDILVVLAVVIITIGLVASSGAREIGYGLTTPDHEIPADWIESLGWMGNSTPDTGIDYYTVYNGSGFRYPSGSYGILATWDAGHWITFFARRIPVTNPFQDNLGGHNGAAAFFLSVNESDADAIAGRLGGRFVITDSKLAVDTFTNLVPWVNGSVDISPYIKYFLVPDAGDSSKLKITHRFDDRYFLTMAARLHNFDGSLSDPKEVEYIRYEIREPTARETADVPGFSRVIIADTFMDASRLDTTTPILKEGKELLPTQYAGIFSGLPNRTTVRVPALRHYRLVHESPSDSVVRPFPESGEVTLPGMKYVKIFEYVKGARIAGEGTIGIRIRTNTGREFVYRQESEQGMFIVPYPTSGSLYDVRAVSDYQIVGSTRSIQVSEKDIEEGNLVS